MTNSFIQAIADRLTELYPGITINDEDVPQNFVTPSFSIYLTDQDYSKRMNVKFKSLLSFDIAYFSASTLDIRNDCLDVQLKLFRGFDFIETCWTRNKRAATVDDVLHFTFDLETSEIKKELSTKMLRQQTNTNIE